MVKLLLKKDQHFVLLSGTRKGFTLKNKMMMMKMIMID